MEYDSKPEAKRFDVEADFPNDRKTDKRLVGGGIEPMPTELIGMHG